MVLMVLSPALAPKRAYAFELGGGFAAVDEGDDRMRPAATLDLSVNDLYGGRLYYYGRTYGPVREDTAVLSILRRWPVFGSKLLTASFGLALMDERTVLKFDNDTDQAKNQTENSYNGGFAFGVTFGLPKTSAPLYMALSWDAHVFPAGVNGGLFLATGRKQTISVILGGMTR